MKITALSIKQPHAGLIAAGIKPVENRGWISKHTPGLLAICASKAPEPKYIFDDMRKKCAALGVPFPEKLCAINGMCIATANVIGHIHMVKGAPTIKRYSHDELPPMDDILSWWIKDQYGWIMNKVQTVEPFKVSGRLMLFQIDLPEQEPTATTHPITFEK